MHTRWVWLCLRLHAIAMVLLMRNESSQALSGTTGICNGGVPAPYNTTTATRFGADGAQQPVACSKASAYACYSNQQLPATLLTTMPCCPFTAPPQTPTPHVQSRAATCKSGLRRPGCRCPPLLPGTCSPLWRLLLTTGGCGGSWRRCVRPSLSWQHGKPRKQRSTSPCW